MRLTEIRRFSIKLVQTLAVNCMPWSLKMSSGTQRNRKCVWRWALQFHGRWISQTMGQDIGILRISLHWPLPQCYPVTQRGLWRWDCGVGSGTSIPAGRMHCTLACVHAVNDEINLFVCNHVRPLILHLRKVIYSLCTWEPWVSRESEKINMSLM